MPQLVNMLTGKLMEIHKKPMNLQWMPFNRNDFDEIKEYEQFLAVLRSRLCEIIKVISRLNPIPMLELGIQGSEAILKMSYDVAGVGKNDIGCTPQSTYFKAIESSTLFFMSIFTGIQKLPEEVLAQHKVLLIAHVNTIIKRLLAFPHEDPLCLTKLLDPIVEGSLLLKNDHESLSGIISKVMSLISFVPSQFKPGHQLTTLQKEISANLRRKASCCLVKLAEGFSEQFVPFYSNLFSQIQVFLTSSDVGLSERTFLIEFLMVVGQKVKSESDRLSCLQFICDPLLESWNKSDLVSALQNVHEFIQFIGSNFIFVGDLSIHQKTVHSEALELAQARRAKLSYLINTSLVVLKRLEPEYLEFLASYSSLFVQKVSPNIFRVLSSLDSLWISSSWTSFTAGSDHAESIIKKLLDLSLEEKKNLLGYCGFSREDGPEETQLDKLIVDTKIWLGNVRLICYQWVDQICYNPTNYQLLGSYWDFLFHVIFSGQFQLRFWKHFLLSVVSPLILKCPEHLFKSHLMSWLSLFITKTTEYLDQLWKAFSNDSAFSPTEKISRQRPAATLQKENEADDEDEKDEGLLDELLHERLLRSTTHAYASIFLDLFFPLNERNQMLIKATSPLQSPQQSQINSPLLSFLVNGAARGDPSVSATFEAFLQSLLVFFSWKDSYTAEKAITVCQRLLVHLSYRLEYADYFGRALFVATLGTLADGYHAELHDAGVALICQIYASYRSQSESVLLSIPGLYQQAGNVSTDPSLVVGAFRKCFDEATDTKKKKVLTKQFLKPILGLKHSSLFKLDDSLAGIKSLPTRLMILQQKKTTQHETVWEQDIGLDTFFDSN